MHIYTLRITFLNKNQDDNQGKRFSAKIRINAYQDNNGVYYMPGVINYSNSTFWYDQETMDYKAEYKTNPITLHSNASTVGGDYFNGEYYSDEYTAYYPNVYNDNTNVKPYIDNYVEYLSNMGYSVTGRIPLLFDFYREDTQISDYSGSNEWVTTCQPNNYNCYLPYFKDYEEIGYYITFYIGNAADDNKDEILRYSTISYNIDHIDPIDRNLRNFVYPVIIIEK